MSARTSPSAYRHWQDRVRGMLEPLAALMRTGAADLPLAGPPSDHDAQADRLESFARPMLLAAFYLQTPEETDESGGPLPAARALRTRTAAWFQRGLVAGTDASGKAYWGPDANYHQHHVEMGLMAIALQFARAQLWDPLSETEKTQVADWFATCRGGGIVNNNHLFMSVHILEFLGRIGREHRTDAAVITAHLNQLETMHRGGGWFEDGINQAYDHYNAYAFHFYGLWWARLHGTRDPARAERWRGWARLFVRDYQHFFAASGEHPTFGRSITYRFNAVAVFGLVAAEGATDLPPGLLRRLCTRNLDFFLARPITQEQGCLGYGFTDRFDDIIEPYSCPGSVYWCAKGLTPLLLPPDHPFWTSPEQPLPAERGDFAHPIPPAGLLVRGVDGEVEILNAGSMVSNTQLRYGSWKWGKVAYRTGVGFCYAFPPAETHAPDSGLTQQLDDGRIQGRHSTVTVEMDGEHLGCSWNLGSKAGQINTGVETFVWWRRGWILQVHRTEARQPVTLRLGGYALPLERPVVERSDPAAVLSAWAEDGRGSVLQSLKAGLTPEWQVRLDDRSRRLHVQAPYHATPMFRAPRGAGPGWLAALAWAGRSRAEAAPWRLREGRAGYWMLEHAELGVWEIKHWALPEIDL
jgi:hypothetical protein